MGPKYTLAGFPPCAPPATMERCGSMVSLTHPCMRRCLGAINNCTSSATTMGGGPYLDGRVQGLGEID
eukprot:8708602-Pyramimonas_sp.AAC.1